MVDETHWVHTFHGRPAQWIRDHAAYAGDDCIPWPFAKDNNVGRGRISIKRNGIGDSYWAHRVMCEYVIGPAPTPVHQAAHECGHGHLACMNWKHLGWKTQSENQLDRRRHGTAKTGIGSRAKLTATQIAQIRALKGQQTQMETARQFNISHANVRYWQGERDKKRTSPPRAARE